MCECNVLWTSFEIGHWKEATGHVVMTTVLSTGNLIHFGNWTLQRVLSL